MARKKGSPIEEAARRIVHRDDRYTDPKKGVKAQQDRQLKKWMDKVTRP